MKKNNSMNKFYFICDADGNKLAEDIKYDYIDFDEEINVLPAK